MSLAGYTGFAFGEGRLDRPFRHVGGLYEKGTLRQVWDNATSSQWTADSIGFTAHFLINAQSPAPEVHEKAVAMYFAKAGATVLAFRVRDEEFKGMIIRSVEIKMPFEDLARAKTAIRNLDAAGNGPLTRRTQRSGNPGHGNEFTEIMAAAAKLKGQAPS